MDDDTEQQQEKVIQFTYQDDTEFGVDSGFDAVHGLEDVTVPAQHGPASADVKELEPVVSEVEPAIDEAPVRSK